MSGRGDAEALDNVEGRLDLDLVGDDVWPLEVRARDPNPLRERPGVVLWVGRGTLASLVFERSLLLPNFGEALRRALRQDPDMILVGEMRDLETIDAAITAAETGHLVFGTLHTTGAAKTVDRIVNAFPTNQQEQIRIQLSTVLQAVISQLLIPRIDKPGRVAIFEIMVNTPSIGALIRDNKTFRLNSDIQTGAKYGMVTLDSFLLDKYMAGMIAREEVITKAQDPITIQAKLQELELAASLNQEAPKKS